MATDTARVQLELACGRNEITAPFHQTAQRRQQQLESSAASVGAPEVRPEPTQFVVDVPLGEPPSAEAATEPARKFALERLTRTARPSWIAFVAALVAAVAVWWIMSQRMPDIDPREVIVRNLNDAQAAMAEGRYTDPPERSALHYYSTVLAVDPDNTDAIAGIDAIVDRQLTNARVLLAEKKIAEAGVALEKARRVRPEHEGLAALDAQWRSELRQLVVASNVVPKVVAPPPQRTAANAREPVTPSKPVAKAPNDNEPRKEDRRAQNEIVEDEIEALTPTPVTNLDTAAAALAASPPPMPLETLIAPAVEPAPERPGPMAPTPASEPKLIRMVQPEYPQEALMRGLEGWVDVSLQISASGDVIEPRVEESSRGRMFNRAALSAVQQWKYEPRSDETTSERVRVRVEFRKSR